MKLNRVKLCAFTLCFILLLSLPGQTRPKSPKPRGPLTESGYNKSVPSVVKLMADHGQRVGAGVIVGIQKNGGGLVLTSYSMVAGQDEVAVVVRNGFEPLVGQVHNPWIDLNLDIAMVLVHNFPPGLSPISFKQEKLPLVGETLTLIGHAGDQDWGPIEIQISDENQKRMECSLGKFTGIDGAPLVDETGTMIGLTVSDAVQKSTENHVALAVKTGAIKPVVNGWLKSLALRSKWRERKDGVATWIWALGGGVLGGAVTAAILITGGGSDNVFGLPRPPQPPDTR